MTSAVAVRKPEGFLSQTSRFLAGGSFPAFALCMLVLYQVFIAWMGFAPPARGAWGAFLEDFRIRCFQFDPEKGSIATGSIWVMIAEPIPLQLMLVGLWRKPLLDLWRRDRWLLFPISTTAAMFVVVIALSLFKLGARQVSPAELPFPADRLRSSLEMPAFSLTNQEGEVISPEDLKGRVVVVTAVYSSCTKTCPMILSNLRSVLDGLTSGERDELTVVALSLSPETDTKELRQMTARFYGMNSTRFHFVNGKPGEVNALLDRLGVARETDPETGQIMHSNLFFLLDQQGKIAYRLSLSEREQSWLPTAIRVLLAEKRT